jgi:GNAT superfamily N-acetyltransferase
VLSHAPRQPASWLIFDVGQKMKLSWREASVADLGLLAEWNHQLIRDEGHRNSMTIDQLAQRMKGWLQGEYRAVVFSQEEPVGYALFRREESLIYLRQLFVQRDRRRAGIGRAAFAILRDEIWPRDVRLTVDVLCQNQAAIAFWRSVGYRDYCLTLEIMP